MYLALTNLSSPLTLRNCQNLDRRLESKLSKPDGCFAIGSGDSTRTVLMHAVSYIFGVLLKNYYELNIRSTRINMKGINTVGCKGRGIGQELLSRISASMLMRQGGCKLVKMRIKKDQSRSSQLAPSLRNRAVLVS